MSKKTNKAQYSKDFDLNDFQSDQLCENDDKQQIVTLNLVEKNAPNESQVTQKKQEYSQQQFPSKENRKTLQKKNQKLFQALQNSNTKSLLQEEIQKHKNNQDQTDEQNFNFQIEQSNVYSQNLSHKSDLGIKNQELQEINTVIQNELNESLKIIEKQQIYIQELQKQNESLNLQLQQEKQKVNVNSAQIKTNENMLQYQQQIEELINKNKYLTEFCQEFSPEKFDSLLQQNEEQIDEIKSLKQQLEQNIDFQEEFANLKQKLIEKEYQNNELCQSLTEIENELQKQIQLDNEKFQTTSQQRKFIDQQKSLLKSQRIAQKNNFQQNQLDINQAKNNKQDDTSDIMQMYLKNIIIIQQQIETIMNDLQQEKQQNYQTINDLKEENKNITQQLQDIELREQEYQDELEAYEKELNQLLEKSQQQQQEIDEFNKQNNQQQFDQIQQKDQEILSANKQISLLEKQNQDIIHKNSKLENMWSKIQKFFKDDMIRFVIESICQIETEIKGLEDKLIETQFEMEEQSLVQSLSFSKTLHNNFQPLDLKNTLFIQQDLNQKIEKQKELMHKLNKLQLDFVKKQENFDQQKTELENLKHILNQRQNDIMCNQSMFSENVGSVNQKRPRSSYYKVQQQRQSVRRIPNNNSVKLLNFNKTHNVFSYNNRNYNDIKNKLENLREKYNNIS